MTRRLRRIKLSDKQKEFWRLANHRWNIKEGATRSGKTFLDYYRIPKKILSCRGEGLIVLLGNTRGTLTRNIIDPMRSIWGKELVGSISNNNTVNLFGKRCYALGADKVSQAERLQGSGIEYCYGDEMTTWNEEVFQMLKSRLDKPHSSFDGTCNPSSPGHWLLKFLNSDADIFRQHYTIYDNPFLTEDFVRNLEREYRGTVFYDRYILGKWTLAEGLVYPMFSNERHTVSKLPESGRYFVSIDYGTLNPTSMGLWRTDGVTATRIKEYYHSGRDTNRLLTDAEYYDALLALCGDIIPEAVIIDPSAASFITLIKKMGRFSVKKAKNDVLEGIRTTAGFIAADKIFIHCDCKDILREFGEYRWDPAAMDDKVIKENDHAMDDMRYFVNTVFKRL